MHPDFPRTRLRGLRQLAASLGVLVLGIWPEAAEATPPSARIPLIRRLGSALFPPSNPGYLPLVGSPGLRFGEEEESLPITTPPVVLYSPRSPKEDKPAIAETPPTVEPVTEAKPEPSPATADRKPPPLRPEDFLPYFQLNDGSSRSAPGEGFMFTPARSELPTSQAEFRQQ